MATKRVTQTLLDCPYYHAVEFAVSLKKLAIFEVTKFLELFQAFFSANI
jgi:hypothetical protein